MVYKTYFTKQSGVRITQERHPANQAVDIQIQPRGGSENTVCSVIDGRVRLAGAVEDASYGISVVVDGTGKYAGYTLRVAHLASVTTSPGASVFRGALLGYEGVTGNTTGPHVHLELLFKGEPTASGDLVSVLGFPIDLGLYDVEFIGGSTNQSPEKNGSRGGFSENVRIFRHDFKEVTPEEFIRLKAETPNEVAGVFNHTTGKVILARSAIATNNPQVIIDNLVAGDIVF